ncbi:MAG: ParB/RepB/Spo0J family partition protein [Clostridia bacterium]|nr:ParB/RepB/Spo0J family partition protein [Clostridia bacterium]
MKEKKLNPNWDIVRKALGKEPQTIDAPKNHESVERHDAPKPGIMTLPLDTLWPFPDHPYKVIEDEALDQLAESIRENGILSPVIVRPVEGTDEYEIISGHRRCRAAEMIGLKTVPVIVSDLSPDEAVIQMVDSNLHREHLLPSEKAFAYKMKLEAMRRKAGRPKKDNSTQLAANYRSDDAAAEAFGVSGDTMRRYVRLTNLIPELLEYMDRDEMALSVGEALSYLDEDMQRFVLDAMEAEDCTPSYSQAVRMKNLFRNGDLDEDGIMAVMSEQKANQREHVSIPVQDIRRFFPAEYSIRDIQRSILRMLEDQATAKEPVKKRSREAER